MEVVSHRPCGGPLFDTEPERRLHVHATSFNALPRTAPQLRSEELVERLFLPISAKPQRLTRLQIADHRKKFGKSIRPHRALRQTEPPGTCLAEALSHA